MRNSLATDCCRTPWADSSPAMVASRSSGVPRTDTYTRAWRRSGLVSTEVTVTNPMRGSRRPSVIRSETTSRTASFTRRMRSAILEKVFPGHHPAFHRCALGKHRDDVPLHSRGSITQIGNAVSDECGGQFRALPQLVMSRLGHRRSEAPVQLSLQRAQLPALALEASVVGEVEVDLEDADVAQPSVCSTCLIS